MPLPTEECFPGSVPSPATTQSSVEEQHASVKPGLMQVPKPLQSGAIGFMGATVSSPVGPTDSLALYQFKGYFQHEMYHMGAAFDYGKIKAYEYTGSTSNSNMHLFSVNLSTTSSAQPAPLYT